MAFRMQTAAPEAFDWQSEPAAVQEKYHGLDGKLSDFGMNCLLARRLVERGFALFRFIMETISLGTRIPRMTRSTGSYAVSRIARLPGCCGI
jgi:hypothetical protein